MKRMMIMCRPTRKSKIENFTRNIRQTLGLLKDMTL